MAHKSTETKTGPGEGKEPVPDWLKDVLECPGCQHVMTDGPIRVCGNDHSLCLQCCEAKEKCPVCQAEMTERRNLMVESIVGKILNCEFDRCHMKDEAPEIPEWMKRALECPVCLEIIMDPPIYVCENPHGHSVCSTCHESLQKEGKTCPVCRKKMKNRRNVTLESMLESNPNKVKCKFDGCDFKRSDGEAVKKHEDGCENRYVPCAKCDDEIGQKGLAEHVIQKHCDGVQYEIENFGDIQLYYMFQDDVKKDQAVITITDKDDCNKFLENWCILDEVTTLFWLAAVGPKESASSYKYTLQVQRSRTEEDDFVFEGTRHCVPCDLSHKDMKAQRCALILDKKLIDNATKDNGRLYYQLTIRKA